MATGDLDGAASTLERVLLVDPRSKLAKMLMADVSLRKGDFLVARNILGNLLQEEDTPDEMAARAEALLAEVDARLDPTKVQARMALEYGSTENAFGRANSDEIPEPATGPTSSGPACWILPVIRRRCHR